VKSRDYDDNAFWEQVNSDSPTFLGFWTHTCAPCKVMAPIFERLGKRYRNRIEFVAVSTYDRPDMAKKFNVSSTPTFLLVQGGKQISRFTGTFPEKVLYEHLAPYAPEAPTESAPERRGFFSRVTAALTKK
jgi:thioredoxin-like negative regulator of GroEL